MKSWIPLRFFAQPASSKRLRLFAREPALCCVILCFTVTAKHLRADFSSTDQPSATPNPSENTRYGLFGLLDHRSSYGQGVFPEPFLVDDSDLEQNEARLDWFHSALANDHSDLITAEVEKGFGNLTLEVEIPFERDAVGGNVPEGFDNIDLGARYPLAQYVASDGSFDTTVGVAIEVGIPTNSTLSKNAEWVRNSLMTLELATISRCNQYLATRRFRVVGWMEACRISNTGSSSAIPFHTTSFPFPQRSS